MEALLYNPENLLGDVGVAQSYVTYGKGENGNFVNLLAEISFPNNIDISSLGSTLTFQYYNRYQKTSAGYWEENLGGGAIRIHHPYSEESTQWFKVFIYFNDESFIELSTQGQGNNVWKTYTIDLTADSSKKITMIKIYSHSNTYSYLSTRGFDFANITPNSAYIGKFQIKNIRNGISYYSNKLEFKVGSNYYTKLEEAECTDLLAETAHNVVATNNMENIIGSQLSDVPIYTDNFSTIITFSETPEETNNAKLLIRYNDDHGDQQLGGLRIVLTYFGDIEYELLSPTILSESQDLILNVPDGKYIKTISIYATETDYLQNVQLGMLRLYNNVPNEVISQFHKYPILQATAADTTRTRYSFLNINPIEAKSSGYIMLGRSGAWILPGTNVIRKQKNQPTINDDPALKTGDIWLNIGSEPLVAYVYVGGFWQICQDVPIGYVTLLWSNPTASATVTKINDSHSLSASVNAQTFAQQAVYSGEYVFTFDGTNWTISESTANMTLYGITVTGTPVEGDIITVNFTASTSTIDSLETYPYNQNGYNMNIYTTTSAALTGRDGRDGQNGRDGKNGTPGPQGPAGVGIPTGGTTGQILAKASNANYSTKWTNMVSNALFDGGQAGMTLIKNSSDNLDFSWGNIQVLPTGGTSGEALVKNSSVNYDASWQQIHQIPAGGAANQVLTKLSSNDQDVAWMNPGGGISLASLQKMDFKTSMYFKSSVDGYTNLLLEQFIGLDGVNITDRPNVLTYYSGIDANIENTSGETLEFRLIGSSFSQPVNYIELEADYTGTITFKYSIDSGETYVNFPEDQMLQVTTSSLILKIEMAVNAILNNIAIFVK